jgi:hypothetical protein
MRDRAEQEHRKKAMNDQQDCNHRIHSSRRAAIFSW